MRTRLWAVARKPKNQSTRSNPRNLILRIALSNLPQPNTFSTNLRFFRLTENPGSFRDYLASA